jgi:hypothetical protein
MTVYQTVQYGSDKMQAGTLEKIHGSERARASQWPEEEKFGRVAAT